MNNQIDAIEQMEVDEEQAHPDDPEPMEYEDSENQGNYTHDNL